MPCVVLQLDAAEVLDGGDALDLIDRAVSKWVGIVVLNSGEGGGGKLYEAACKLKSVVGDRAYLLIAERVDIATAVNASGVVLSDQGCIKLNFCHSNFFVKSNFQVYLLLLTAVLTLAKYLL